MVALEFVRFRDAVSEHGEDFKDIRPVNPKWAAFYLPDTPAGPVCRIQAKSPQDTRYVDTPWHNVLAFRLAPQAQAEPEKKPHWRTRAAQAAAAEG